MRVNIKYGVGFNDIDGEVYSFDKLNKYQLRNVLVKLLRHIPMEQPDYHISTMSYSKHTTALAIVSSIWVLHISATVYTPPYDRDKTDYDLVKYRDIAPQTELMKVLETICKGLDDITKVTIPDHLFLEHWNQLCIKFNKS